MEHPSNYTEQEYLESLPTSDQKWMPGQHRDKGNAAFFIVLVVSIVMFAVSWIVYGAAQWESSLMALALLVVVAILKTIEPRMRAIAVRRQEKRLDELEKVQK